MFQVRQLEFPNNKSNISHIIEQHSLKTDPQRVAQYEQLTTSVVIKFSPTFFELTSIMKSTVYFSIHTLKIRRKRGRFLSML